MNFIKTFSGFDRICPSSGQGKGRTLAEDSQPKIQHKKVEKDRNSGLK
jgi:hypothetical protein